MADTSFSRDGSATRTVRRDVVEGVGAIVLATAGFWAFAVAMCVLVALVA